MGKIINITCNQAGLQVGGFKRVLLTPDTGISCSCNEPYKERYWCPKQKWFMADPCDFTNRFECQLWEDQCYGKTY